MPNIEDYIGKGREMLAADEDDTEFKVGERVIVVNCPGVENLNGRYATLTEIHEDGRYRGDIDGGHGVLWIVPGKIGAATAQRPFPIGTLVVVNKICDVGYYDHEFPQVVKIDENEYGAGQGECGSAHNYLAQFTEAQWCFSDAECEPYTGSRTDAPFVLDKDDDEDDEEEAADRPTTGDLLILHRREDDWSRSQNPDSHFPQVVLIERDDHDGCPWKITTLGGEDVYVTEEFDDDDDGEPVWERYTGDRDASEAPFLLAPPAEWVLRIGNGEDGEYIGPFKTQAALTEWARRTDRHGAMIEMERPE